METLSPNSSILFLGSGFSAGATNIAGEALPLAGGLKSKFSRILQLPDDSLDLKNLADEIDYKNDPPLYDLLYNTFTAGAVSRAQRSIISCNWQRIYTTNYDDVVEFCLHSANIKYDSYSCSDLRPNKVPSGSVIHLHGDIRHTTLDNVLEQLVLNERSYVLQYFEQSRWYDQFIRDLRFCTACFFIGYSLSDFHIAALLSGVPRLKGRLYFVTAGEPDSIFRRRIGDYSGEILAIGTEGFANLCSTLPRPANPTDPNSARAFRYVHPTQNKSLARPTPQEILNLCAVGNFSASRCFSVLPAADYVAPRAGDVCKAVKLLESNKTLLVHSRLGNGKTIFLSLLAYALSEANYKCFMARSNAVPLQEDLRLISSFDQPVLIFDSYNAAMDFPLSDLPEAARVVVAVRTSVQDVRLHEMDKHLPKPMARIDLNLIHPQDRADIANIVSRVGALTAGERKIMEECRDIREIVVRLYDNKQIRERLAAIISPILQDRALRKVFCVIQMINWAGEEVDAAFIRSVTGRDAYSDLSKHKEVMGDLFRLDEDAIQVRSSIFSEYVLATHLEAEDLLEAVYHIVIEAVRRKDERRYQTLLSTLMKVSKLESVLRGYSGRFQMLEKLYDRLHWDLGVNGEPLFWLQYSILMTQLAKLDVAEKFIETAYDRASAKPRFKTYQIDT